ncbi:MAG: RimK/LysX family protein, partial [Gammaproteobacteria bacterium]|nr:RimK/LysX family protein [Gammaproteobacteria bacterium]
MNDGEEKIIVGSQEWCAFPDLGVPAVKARVDSGATTSSIHAFNIQAFKRHGETWVSFELHPLQGNRRTTLKCEAVVVDRRVIRSSSGITEKRYVIGTTLSLGKQAWNIEISLANRDSMGYRMLLGRQAMGDRILVDPSASFRCGKLSEKDIDRLYGKIEKTHGGLRIALLGTNPRLYSNKRIVEAGDERGHEMTFVDVRQCYTRLDAANPEIRYRGGRVLDDFDALITRIRPRDTLYGSAIARQFENLGVLAMNSSKA